MNRSAARRLAFACFAVAILFDAHRLFGIPQNFSQANPFLIGAGKPAEEFFRDPANWTANAPIPGEPAHNKSRQTSIIEAPGEVFGVTARNLKLLRNSGKELQQVIVSYEAAAAHLSARNLHTRLKTNIAAFLESKAAEGQKELRFANRELLVTMSREAAPTLEIRIMPAESLSSYNPAPSGR